jgi:hypothetical protein
MDGWIFLARSLMQAAPVSECTIRSIFQVA